MGSYWTRYLLVKRASVMVAVKEKPSGRMGKKGRMACLRIALKPEFTSGILLPLR